MAEGSATSDSSMSGGGATERMYPLKFHPVYKEKIWGGDALARLFGRRLPSNKVGESWEIAAHPHGQSIVSKGPLAGTPLAELLRSSPREIMGRTPLADDGRFPLLVKLLDCNDWLSVQVHPDDEYARTHEGDLGKQESWVVLYAAPGAQIVYGLQPGTTRAEFAAAIADNRVEQYLHKVNVKAGDVFSVPAGTVHALGRGVVVAEIQQNSDTVYRVYDWGRLGADGKPRELHVAKALDVIDFTRAPQLSPRSSTEQDERDAQPAAQPPAGASAQPHAPASAEPLARSAAAAEQPAQPQVQPMRPPSLVQPQSHPERVVLDANDKYVIERVELAAEWAPPAGGRFYVYMLLEGGCRMAGGGQELLLQPGDSVLVPAAVHDLYLEPTDLRAVCLRSYVPDSR